MITLDLFGAIMCAGFSTYSQIILAHTVAQFYGPLKKEVVFLSASEASELTGLDRGNARKAINELIDAQVLLPVGGAFSFNKNFDSWTPKLGKIEERLGGKLHAWTDSLPVSFGRKKVPIDPESTKTQTIVAAESTYTQEMASSESTYTQTNTPSESIYTQDTSFPPDPPIGESRASEEKKSIKGEDLNTFLETKTKSTKSKTSEPTQASEPLPEWMPPAWFDWKEHRKNSKHPLTPLAEKIAVGKLTKFHNQGHDLTEILHEAILNDWRGLFLTGNAGSNSRSGVRVDPRPPSMSHFKTKAPNFSHLDPGVDG